MLVNSRTMSAGAWSLVPADGAYFRLQMIDTFAGYGGIPGRILSCGDGLFFENEMENGGNQYFLRVP
jgi:hypothetical protein